MISNEELCHRVAWFAGAAFAATQLGSWCFGTEKELYYSTSPVEKEMEKILRVSGCLDELYREDFHPDRPTYLSDSINLTWVGERVYSDNESNGMVFLIGPFYLSSVSLKNIENNLRRLDVTLSSRRMIMNVLSNVPTLSASMANQYAIMLHYCLTDEYISPREVYYGSLGKNVKNIADSELTDVHLEHVDLAESDDLDERDSLPDEEENVAYDRMAHSESVILNAIRDGNLNFLQILDEEGDVEGKLLLDTGDPLRNEKDTVLIFCAQCARAAIEGGLQLRTAKRIERLYLNEIESCRTRDELARLNIRMMKEWVRLVDQSRKTGKISPEVQQGCDYINANLLRPITVDSVAKEVGYSAYYFSRKFNAEMGMRLSDYIKQQRVEYAKIQLITTKKSIQEISNDLHFGTRNYFSKVFHDVVGVTPKEYRERMGRVGRNL
jgi:AraC-like DNA-binding protein